MSSVPHDTPTLPRRQFLTRLAVASGGLALSACNGSGNSTAGTASIAANTSQAPEPRRATTTSNSSARLSEADRQELPQQTLPAPADSGIDHVVLVTMENRSFDHYLSWVPGAEGMVNGRLYPDAFGHLYSNYHLSDLPSAMGYQGCSFADPNHSYIAGRTHVANGEMNGFLRSPETSKTDGDVLPVGYYNREDLPFYSLAAEHYTICDCYRSGILSETYPNRIYLHTGATDRLSNTMDTSTLPAIWDRLADKGVSASYYFNDIPFTALFGQRFLNLSKPFTQFALDVASGQLPAFSMIDPRFGAEDQGASNDDHPHADIRNGQQFLSQIHETLRSNPAVYARTLIIIVYDEWGGFFDHVPPVKRPVSADEAKLGNDGLLGLRVPCVLLGPRARASHVSQYPLDPASIHQFLQWRFGLEPLGVRATDPDTINLAQALDFSQPAREDAPSLAIPGGVYGAGCLTGQAPIDKPLGTYSTLLEDVLNGGLGAVQAGAGTSNTTAPASARAAELADIFALARQLGFPLN